MPANGAVSSPFALWRWRFVGVRGGPRATARNDGRMNAMPMTRCLLALAGLLVAGLASAENVPGAGLQPCWLDGLSRQAQCGVVRRALDPAQPQGVQIDVHFAVLPAMARHKKPDPVFFLAGGPGQSALGVAGPMAGRFARLNMRRDLVLVDVRGTGRSAPLQCETETPTVPIAQSLDRARQMQRLRECREALQRLPWGDLTKYTTTLAMADVDAVRAALGAQKINLVGGSYGTRAALEYQRLFGAQVRRLVIDGVAPPDMALPASFSPDNQAVLDAVFSACENEPACDKAHPRLRARWQALLFSLPRRVNMSQPWTGQREAVTLTREQLVGLVRGPLYAPALAAGLPVALDEAAHGRFDALLGLASAMAPARPGTPMAAGLHFSVVCAEDMSRLAASADKPGADFGRAFEDIYREVCAHWPVVPVDSAFYEVGVSAAPALVLSGGLDPVTPPRHGKRVAAALGAKAQHVTVANAGHGLLGLGCANDVVHRFINAANDAAAMALGDVSCLLKLRRPVAYQPVRAGVTP